MGSFLMFQYIARLRVFVGEQSPSLLITLFILAIVCIIQVIHSRRKLRLPGIPLISKPKSYDYRAALNEANKKYPNQPYMVPFQDPTVIIPVHCIEQLKNLPDSQLSTNGSMYDRFAIQHTGSGWVDKELAHSIKYDLANEVDDFFPTIIDEIQHAASQSLGFTHEWISIAPQETLVRIVGPVLGRMMVGAPVNRDNKWLSASINHAIAVVTYSSWLRQFPAFLRPFFARLLPQKGVVDKSKKDIEDIIRPIINSQLHDTNKKPDQIPTEQGRLARWLLKRYKAHEDPRFSPSLVLRDHFSLCFAAIHGPTFLVLQAIIDLASYPQYVTPLREEIDRELSKAPFEKWTRETVASLTFMDAFCKESARMNPQGIIAWLRKTHEPITLSTGHVIPANTLVAATNPLYNPNATCWIEDAGIFYPERWMKDQTDSHQDASFRFGSATTDSLIFGYGKHACPGRPFGVALVKSILAYIVSKWDVRLAGGLLERPANIHMDFMVIPPIKPLGNLEVEFKLRT